MDGDAALVNMLETIRALHTIAERAAKLAAPRVEEAIRAQVGRGLDPDGHPWAPTKDGRRPLAHAADAIHGEARGDVVVIILRGPEVFHHYGTGRIPARRILPDGNAVPDRIRRILDDAAAEAFGGKR